MDTVTAAQAVQGKAEETSRRAKSYATVLKGDLEAGRFPDSNALDLLASLRIQHEQWTEALNRIRPLGVQGAVVKMAQILRQMAKEAVERAMDSTGDSDGFWRAQVEGERLGWAQFYRQATQLADQMVQE